MSTILRYIPLVVVVTMILLFLGCHDRYRFPDMFVLKYKGESIYEVSAKDTAGGQRTALMKVVAIDCTACPPPSHIEMWSVPETLGGGGDH